jgi:hypothetical protein
MRQKVAPGQARARAALVHGMTVATRNVADFAASGVPWFNPWLEQPA